MTNQQNRNIMRTSFTLIELLVVVAIFGILVSILLPSLQKARYKSKMAVCVSNLSQIGKGLTMDSMENNGIVWLINYNNRKKVNYYVHRPDVRELSWGKFVYGDQKMPNELYHCDLFENPSYSLNGSNNFPDNYGQKYRAGYVVNAQTAHNNLSALPFLAELDGIALASDYINSKQTGKPNGDPHQFRYGTSALWDDGHVKLVPKSEYYHLLPASQKQSSDAVMTQIWEAISNYGN